MSLSSIASLDEKKELGIVQAMMTCFVCKKITNKDDDSDHQVKGKKKAHVNYEFDESVFK